MTIEAAVLVVILVVPLFYVVATVGRVQAGAYAASAAAREAGRAFATAEDVSSAPARAQAAAGLVFKAHGFEAGEGVVAVSCPDTECLAPGSAVQVASEVVVPLPLVPDFMRGSVPSSVTVTASHRESVDEFRAGR